MVSKIFFSSNLVGRIFFTAVQEFFFTFVLHAIFFFRQALAGNLFSKSPTPSLKSSWSAPKVTELNRCKSWDVNKETKTCLQQ